MLSTIGVLVDLQGLLVQLLSISILLPLYVNPSQLVQGAGYTGVIWVQSGLSDFKGSL